MQRFFCRPKRCWYLSTYAAASISTQTIISWSHTGDHRSSGSWGPPNNKVIFPWEKNGQIEIHCFWLGAIPRVKNRVNGHLCPRRYVVQVTSPDILPPDFKYPYLYVPTHLCSQPLCIQHFFPITLMYPYLYIFGRYVALWNRRYVSKFYFPIYCHIEIIVLA